MKIWLRFLEAQITNLLLNNERYENPKWWSNFNGKGLRLQAKICIKQNFSLLCKVIHSQSLKSLPEYTAVVVIPVRIYVVSVSARKYILKIVISVRFYIQTKSPFPHINI